MEATTVVLRCVPRGLRVSLERVTKRQVHSQIAATIDWYTLYKSGALEALLVFHDRMDGEHFASGDEDPCQQELW